ncbi:MAG: lytic transglycosylase domain-containing protein [Terriglobales bacterium]
MKIKLKPMTSTPPEPKSIRKSLRTCGRTSGAIFCLIAVTVLGLPAVAADLAVLSNGFKIRHEHHQVIGNTTRLYFSADDASFTDIPTVQITSFEADMTPAPSQQVTAVSSAGSIAAPSLESNAASAGALSAPTHSRGDLNEVVNSASAQYHLDPDLVNSVIHAESGFNSHAVSPKGARGLMQLMPSTASGLGVTDPFDAEANIGGGSRYLRELLERYNFDLVKALAAYNAGPERVERYHGVPPFTETRAYVARIVHDYNRKKIAQEKSAARLQKTQAAQSAKQSSPAAASRVSSRKSRSSASAGTSAATKFAPKYASETTLKPAAQLADSSPSTASSR